MSLVCDTHAQIDTHHTYIHKLHATDVPFFDTSQVELNCSSAKSKN